MCRTHLLRGPCSGGHRDRPGLWQFGSGDCGGPGRHRRAGPVHLIVDPLSGGVPAMPAGPHSLAAGPRRSCTLISERSQLVLPRLVAKCSWRMQPSSMAAAPVSQRLRGPLFPRRAVLRPARLLDLDDCRWPSVHRRLITSRLTFGLRAPLHRLVDATPCLSSATAQSRASLRNIHAVLRNRSPLAFRRWWPSSLLRCRCRELWRSRRWREHPSSHCPSQLGQTRFRRSPAQKFREVFPRSMQQ